jgi:hypothetical protein
MLRAALGAASIEEETEPTGRLELPTGGLRKRLAAYGSVRGRPFYARSCSMVFVVDRRDSAALLSRLLSSEAWS